MSAIGVGSSKAVIVLTALAIGAFAIGMDTFVTIGVLANILHELRITTPYAGSVVWAYALVYAISAPISSWALRDLDRRHVMLLSLSLFALGNIVCGISGSLW